MTVREMVVKMILTEIASRICSFGGTPSVDPKKDVNMSSKCVLTRFTLPSARRLTVEMLASTSKLSAQDCRMQSVFLHLMYSRHLKRFYEQVVKSQSNSVLIS